MKKIIFLFLALPLNIAGFAQTTTGQSAAASAEAKSNLSTPENVCLLVCTLILFAFVFVLFYALGKATSVLADKVGEEFKEKNPSM